MRTARWAEWLAVPARCYLGVLFIGASVHKVADPSSFAVDIATYEILPLAAVNLVAIVLPWIELVAGVMLVVGLRVRTGAWLVTGMMLVFMSALIIALARGLDMSCGCFASQGAIDDPISGVTVLRDLAWLGLAVLVLAADRGKLGMDGWLHGRVLGG